jgi:hypothetical protein
VRLKTTGTLIQVPKRFATKNLRRSENYIYCYVMTHLVLTVARPKSPILTVKLSSCKNMLLDLRSLKKIIYRINYNLSIIRYNE